VVSFLQVSQPKPCMHLYIPHSATLPISLILLDLISQITFGEYTSLIFSVCSLFYSTVTSSHLGSNIFLCTLFSNIFSPCSFLNISNQVSHPYKTRGKNHSSVYLNLYIFGKQTGRQKILH